MSSNSVAPELPRSDSLEPLLVPRRETQRVLACGPTYYRGLVKKGKILEVGTHKAARTYWPSVRNYVAQLVKEASAASSEAADVAGTRHRQATKKANADIATE